MPGAHHTREDSMAANDKRADEAAEPAGETSADQKARPTLVDADDVAEGSYELADPADSELASIDPDDEDDPTSEDSLTFSNGVIEKIVAIAVQDVPGVLGMKGGWVSRVQETFGASRIGKGVTVEVSTDNRVRVNLSVFIEYGIYAPQVFEDVKKVVVKQVTGMTGLEVSGVNLRIEDVLTPAEYKGAREREEAAAAEAEAAEETE
jgi:uncharacterized alkaline shock family protein YloU